MKTITILGAGSFGCALALLLHRNHNRVRLWGRDSKFIKSLQRSRSHSRYLKKASLPKAIEITSDLQEALKGTDLVVLATPTQAIRQLCRGIRSDLSSQTPILCVAKGLELKTGKRNSQIIKEELSQRQPLLILSGPSHSEEIIKCLPCTVTLASKSKNLGQKIGKLFHNQYFRVYYNNDIAGVEIGGAIKNIIAIAGGICDGLKLGDNAKAALITRGLVEIKKFGHAEGAKARTFDGLSGLGDLITTCFSPYSRNRAVGEALGQGQSLNKILKSMNQVAEGISTTYAVMARARDLKVEMPISDQVASILKGHRQPRAALEILMKRQAKSES